VVTSANPDLRPEKLYGAELGYGGAWDTLQWDATAFWNRLHNAIANVTIGENLQQRQNAGDVQAFGFEGQLRDAITEDLGVWSAISYTGAQFVSGQLDGLRPAQAPRTVITAGIDWGALDALVLEGQLHWEGLRFENDINTLRIGSAFMLDLRATYDITERLAAYFVVTNATDAQVATAANTDFLLGTVTSYGEPRVFWLGLRYGR
jgi:outer membrane receptor protein involved in Fe transport